MAPNAFQVLDLVRYARGVVVKCRGKERDEMERNERQYAVQPCSSVLPRGAPTLIGELS